MPRLIDHLVRNAVLLMLAMLVVSWLLGGVVSLFGDIARLVTSLMGGVLVFAATVALIVGVGARGARALAAHGARGDRQQVTRARQSRQAARRLAEEAPIVTGRVIPVDRDPALGGGEEWSQ